MIVPANYLHYILISEFHWNWILRFSSSAGAALLLILTIGATQGAVAQTPPNLSASETPDEANLIHFGDLVDVDVVGSFEFDWRGTVTPEGFLEGFDRSEEQIFAVCRSEEQIAADITMQFSKTLRDPKVVVKILDRSNRAAALLTGAVKTPQRFQLRRSARLNELLALSGGITDNTSGEVVIFRPIDLNCSLAAKSKGASPTNTFTIALTDILEGKEDANPPILSGDVITVTEASPIYVIGGVNAPKQVASRSEITLSRAIASAGGLAKDGVEDDVTIYRRETNGSKTINANLKKIRNGEEEDPPLRSLDIVDVGQKGRGKRSRPPRINGPLTGGQGLFKLPLKIID